MFEANEMKVLRKLVDKTKIDRIRCQQIREYCSIKPIHEWIERRREWDQHVTRIYAERIVKISRDNIPVGRRFPGRPKRRWGDLMIETYGRTPTQKSRNKTSTFREYCTYEYTSYTFTLL